MQGGGDQPSFGTGVQGAGLGQSGPDGAEGPIETREDGAERVRRRPRTESPEGRTETGSTPSSQAVETAQGTGVAVLVSAPGDVTDGPLPSGAGATIWVGAYDDSGPVPSGLDGETLEVTVERPDKTVETFSRQTDTHGGASVGYDLSTAARGDGTYTVTVTAPDQGGVSATATVDVGLTVTPMPDRTPTVLTGEEFEFSFLAHDGTTGVGGVSLTLRATHDGSTVAQTTTQTDSDGFATLSVTPSSVGQYRIEADRSGSVTSMGVEAVDLYGHGSFRFAQGRVGSTSAFGGFVASAAGPYSNSDVVVEFFTDLQRGTRIDRVTTTTDDRGFFLVDYHVPATFDGDWLVAMAETPSGTEIRLGHRLVLVDSGYGPSTTGPVFLDTVGDSPTAPGQTIEVDISARDGVTDITGQDVDVVLRYEEDGPPFFSSTATTDGNGEATVSATLPADAPDGYNIEGAAGMTYDGSTYTDRVFSKIRQYDVDVQLPTLTPGTTETVSISATENPSGDPAQGVPFQFDAGPYLGEGSSFGTGGLTSEADGTASTTVDVPSDLVNLAKFDGLGPYMDEGWIKITWVDHPGTLSTSDTIDAGGTTTFDFAIPGSESVHGIALGRTSLSAVRTFGTRFQGPGSFSLEIPPEFGSADSVSMMAMATDTSGTVYLDEQSFSVDSGALAVYAAGEKAVSSGGSGYLDITATSVSQVTITDLWTDWTLDATRADAATVTDDIASSGRVELQYDTVQSSVNPKFTFGLPPRYVGGTYGITVTAENDQAGTVEDAAILSIE